MLFSTWNQNPKLCILGKVKKATKQESQRILEKK